jgi:hypothetical protein
VDRPGLYFDGVLVVDFPYGDMLTVLTAVDAAPDVYGDVIAGTPTESEWGPCAVAPRTSSDREDSRTPAVVTGLTIYGPARSFAATTQVVIPSGAYAGTWDVEGIPGVWSSPFTGWAPGVEVAVVRASGS